MAYNQGLAVGLAVGLPCFIVLIGSLFLYRRNRRKMREEDLHDTALDAEMNETGSFKEFGEALHSPVQHIPNTDAGISGNLARKLTPKTPADMRTSVATKSVSVSTESASDSSKTHSSLGKSSYSTGQNRRSPSGHISSYDFYDTFIPIMPSDMQPEPSLVQPPSLTQTHGTPERQSIHSSRASLLPGDTSYRSLENLAKQLQGPQFFEKVPSRAASALPKHPPRRMTQPSSKSSSMTDLGAGFENGGINDHFVNEKPMFYAVESNHNRQSSSSQSPPPIGPHPYREMAGGHSEMHEVGNTLEQEIISSSPEVEGDLK